MVADAAGGGGACVGGERGDDGDRGRAEEDAEQWGSGEECPAAHRRLPADRDDEPAAAVWLERGGERVTGAQQPVVTAATATTLTGGPAEDSESCAMRGRDGAFGWRGRGVSVLELLGGGSDRRRLRAWLEAGRRGRRCRW